MVARPISGILRNGVVSALALACGPSRALDIAPAEMTPIEGGQLDGQPIAPFLLDVHEVTAGQYTECVAAGACIPRRTQFWMSEDRGDEHGDCNLDRRPEHPMNCVDQRDAETYCSWRNPEDRLPSLSEFIWAAQGRDQARPFPWGSAVPTAAHVNACGTECIDEWHRRKWAPEVGPLYNMDDGWPTTAPVDAHTAGTSRDGARDLAGNVGEWTSERRGQHVMIAGGSFGSTLGEDLSPRHATFSPPDARNSLTGFRCVRPHRP